jgi:hypothetical protein
MKPNKINYTSQLQINDLIDNAVVNAIARRSSWETLSDDEAARVAGGQTESIVLEEGDPIYLPKDPICVPIESTNRPIKFICPPLVVGIIVPPPNEEEPLAYSVLHSDDVQSLLF